jgi:predicted  nucleic acid-binding Zn-ribbon protein
MEIKKITAEQLEKISVGQKDLQALLTNIGVAESQKHSYLHQLADVNKSIEEFKSEIEAEYGPININLQDGSYTNIVKESGSTDLSED